MCWMRVEPTSAISPIHARSLGARMESSERASMGSRSRASSSAPSAELDHVPMAGASAGMDGVGMTSGWRREGQVQSRGQAPELPGDVLAPQSGGQAPGSWSRCSSRSWTHQSQPSRASGSHSVRNARVARRPGWIAPDERAERPRHTPIADGREMRLEVGHCVGTERRLGEPLDHDGAADDHRLVGLVDADGALTLELPDRAPADQLEAGIEGLPGGERGHERRRRPVAGSGAAPACAFAHQGSERQTVRTGPWRRPRRGRARPLDPSDIATRGRVLASDIRR